MDVLAQTNGVIRPFALELAAQNCFIAEYQVEQNPLFDELLVEPLRIQDGYLYPSTSPGWGVELSEETASRYPFVPREWQMSHQPGRMGQGIK